MQSWGVWPFSSYDPGGGYTILPSPWNIAWCQTLHKLHWYLVSGMYLWRTFGSTNIVSGKDFFNLYFTVLIFSVFVCQDLVFNFRTVCIRYLDAFANIVGTSQKLFTCNREQKPRGLYEVYLILIVDQLCKSLCLRLWSSWVNAMRLILRI